MSFRVYCRSIVYHRSVQAERQGVASTYPRQGFEHLFAGFPAYLAYFRAAAPPRCDNHLNTKRDILHLERGSNRLGPNPIELIPFRSTVSVSAFLLYLRTHSHLTSRAPQTSGLT